MKIFLIGSGGREHALAWKLAQNPEVETIYAAPGNKAWDDLAKSVAISVEDTKGLLDFALKNKIDLTVVGPELPLSLGIVDAFQKEDLKIFGPTKAAAILEASKAYTKEFCTRYHIPTAPYAIFYDASDAKAILKQRKDYPVVIKADGLAAGKGVIIAKTVEEACKAVDSMMVHEKFGEAGRKVIIEDFMPGEEATFLAITDGTNYLPFESSQDHKAIFDGDEGPNTGGMGAYSPAPVVTDEIHQKICKEIIEPMLEGMKKEDRPYLGIIYAGLMIKEGQPRLVEFNCRFGDPEAQAILFRLESDLVELIQSCFNKKLKHFKLQFKPASATCVVISSKGYPGSYEKGKEIKGLKEANAIDGAYVFHAGTKKDDEGRILSHGGRVLGVTALGKDLKSSIKKAYEAVDKLCFEGMYFRKDIGQKGL